MLSKAIIRKVMEEKGVGMVEMAERLGFDYPQKVTNRLYTGKGASLTAETLDQMARALGYKLVVVPVDVKMRDGWYEVDDSVKEGTPRT